MSDYVTAEEFKNMPDEEKTYEMCFEVVAGSMGESAVQFVPEKFLTEEFFLDVLAYNPEIIYYIPERMILSNEFFERAVQTRSRILELVDEKIPRVMLTPEIFEKAIEEDSMAITWLSEPLLKKLLTPESAEKLIGSDGLVEFVDYFEGRGGEEFEEFVEKVATGYVHSEEKLDISLEEFKNMSDGEKTYEMYKRMIEEDYMALDDVPSRILTSAFCLDIYATGDLSEFGYFIQSIPREMLTEEFVSKAAEYHGRIFELVVDGIIPSEMITPEIFEKALKVDKFSAGYLPDEKVMEVLTPELFSHLSDETRKFLIEDAYDLDKSPEYIDYLEKMGRETPIMSSESKKTSDRDEIEEEKKKAEDKEKELGQLKDEIEALKTKIKGIEKLLQQHGIDISELDKVNAEEH